jgi:hypothetical protein
VKGKKKQARKKETQLIIEKKNSMNKAQKEMKKGT